MKIAITLISTVKSVIYSKNRKLKLPTTLQDMRERGRKHATAGTGSLGATNQDQMAVAQSPWHLVKYRSVLKY